MKKLFFLILTFLVTNSFAQILNPVKWEIQIEAISEFEYDVVFTANIDSNWAIYSQFSDPNQGPLPTIISFDNSSSYERVGLLSEKDLNKEKKYDSIFEMVVSKLYDKAVFSQRVKIIETSQRFTIKGNIEFMTCDNTRCTYEPENLFKLDYDPI